MIDAATALAWCFPDDMNGAADRTFDLLAGQTILVPAIWAFEIVNALAVGQRRRRLKMSEIQRFHAVLKELAIVQDTQPAAEVIERLSLLTQEYELTAYDAAYLELALRHKVPLATQDAKLRKAALKAGVSLNP